MQMRIAGYRVGSAGMMIETVYRSRHLLVRAAHRSSRCCFVTRRPSEESSKVWKFRSDAEPNSTRSSSSNGRKTGAAAGTGIFAAQIDAT